MAEDPAIKKLVERCKRGSLSIDVGRDRPQPVMGRRFSHQAVDVDAPPVEKSSLKLQDRSPGTPMKTCQDSIDEDGNLLFISTPPLPRLQPVGDQKLRPTSPKAKNVENKTAAERA